MPFILDNPVPHHDTASSNMSFLQFLSAKNRKSSTLTRKSSTNSKTPTMDPPSPSSSIKNPFKSRHTPPSSVLHDTSAHAPTRRPEALPAYAAAVPTEAPPAYTPPTASTADDPYAFLTTFDTVFVIDDSGSMAGRSWNETAAALTAITPICTSHDADGIDIHFLNHPAHASHRNVTDPGAVAAIFRSVRPMGGTPTGACLHAILKPYLREVEAKTAERVKPLNIIVVTDGVPSDDVESVILAAAKKLDRWDAPAWQVGIQFFQVGQEPGAATALRELDDELGNGADVRDMVDTVPWKGVGGTTLDAQGILKVVLGAVVRRLDRKRQ